MGRHGTVYLICDPETELFKIGVTSGSVEKRLKKLQTGNGAQLHITSLHESEHPFKVEAMLHRKYCAKKTVNEWFSLEPEDVFDFNKTCDAFETILESLTDNPFFNKERHVFD